MGIRVKRRASDQENQESAWLKLPGYIEKRGWGKGRETPGLDKFMVEVGVEESLVLSELGSQHALWYGNRLHK